MRTAARVAMLCVVLATVAAGPAPGPAAAISPPRIDPSALVRSAPVAPPEPTRQSRFCAEMVTAPGPRTPTAAQAMLNLPGAWRFTRGAGQRIAVIDTGVTPHPRLGRVIGGGDYVSSGAGLTDCDAHGTLVAGIIAARPSPDDAFSGVAPESSIISIRQSSSAFERRDRRSDEDPTVGSGYGSVRTLAHAVVRAVALGATVINISEVACVPASAAHDDSALGAAIKYAYDRDVVVVAAAGNLTRDGACREQNPAPAPADRAGWDAVTTVATPAWYSPYLLTVGAVDADTGAPSGFSLHGPWVSVAAPGTGILSLDNTRGSSKLVVAQRGEDGPVPILGTSFATPYVAGTVALVRARFPALSAREVMDRVIATAHAPGTGRDHRIGHGVIDPVAALTAQIPARSPQVYGSAPVAAPAVDPAPDNTARNVALLGVGVCIALLAGVLALSMPRRRVRRLDPDEY